MEFIDRISELPEFILHIILSFLDTKEACRASVLSKIWYDAWSSIPVLDFQPQYFKKGFLFYEHKMNCADLYDMETLKHYMGHIGKTMERYSKQKHVIRKFYLGFPVVFECMKPLLDRWVEIAVENQVQELEIEILLDESVEYDLPEILFCARSLKVLKCDRVKLPNFPTIKLYSLEHLELLKSTVDSDMLQRIISFCPLLDLVFKGCSPFGIAPFGKVSIPWMNTGPQNEVTENTGSKIAHSGVKTSGLRNLVYINHYQCPWPFKMNLAALRNLRKLDFLEIDITDDIVSELVSGLASLESLKLIRCALLNCIKISSISVKEIVIVGCHNLEEATIDAPNLLSFTFYVDLNLVPSITNVNFELRPFLSFNNLQDHCDGNLFIWVAIPCTEWFVKLKEFLIRTNVFKSLTMDMSSCDPEYQSIEDNINWIERVFSNIAELDFKIVLDEDQLGMVNTAAPHKLKEFKLSDTSEWMLEKSSISAFLDLVFWSCHPDVLSIPTSFNNTNVELILSILMEKVQCWRHPLKSMEVEGIDHSRLLDSYLPTFKIRLRLSWQ